MDRSSDNPLHVTLKAAVDVVNLMQEAILRENGVNLWSPDSAANANLPQFMGGKIQLIRALREFSKEYADAVESRRVALEAADADYQVALDEYRAAESRLKAASSARDKLRGY